MARRAHDGPLSIELQAALVRELRSAYHQVNASYFKEALRPAAIELSDARSRLGRPVDQVGMVVRHQQRQPLRVHRQQGPDQPGARVAGQFDLGLPLPERLVEDLGRQGAAGLVLRGRRALPILWTGIAAALPTLALVGVNLLNGTGAVASAIRASIASTS